MTQVIGHLVSVLTLRLKPVVRDRIVQPLCRRVEAETTNVDHPAVDFRDVTTVVSKSSEQLVNETGQSRQTPQCTGTNIEDQPLLPACVGHILPYTIHFRANELLQLNASEMRHRY